MDVGYRLPFIETPEPKQFGNNRSALEHKTFISETIFELLSDGSVKKVPFLPQVVNPLSVAKNSSGKLRLILDLRYVNLHLYKESIRFDDWRSFKHCLTKSGFAYKFDLKKGYHHIDIFEQHQTFLGFCWEGSNYVFTVLPFGLSPAPNIFTKILRPLVSFWHDKKLKICVYLDDGAGTESTFEKASNHSKFVEHTLRQAEFVINTEKSIWFPVQILKWLGITLNYESNTLYISQQRIDSTLNLIANILSSPFSTARKLSKLTGKIVSTKFVMRELVNLKTRYLYSVIEERFSWDPKLNILQNSDAHSEILFWRDNIERLNKRLITQYKFPNLVVFSDASNIGMGIVTNSNIKSHRNFTEWESKQSSTWREIIAIAYRLNSFLSDAKDSQISWFTDKYAATLIVKQGISNKPLLQSLAVQIFEVCLEKT